MKALFEAIRADDAVRRTAACFQKKRGQSFIYGLSGAQKHAVFAAAYEEAPRPFVILVHDKEALEAWRENLSFLLPGRSVVELPAADMVTFQTAAKSLELTAKRMDVLGRLIRKEPTVVLALPTAAAQKGMSKRAFERLSLRLSVGEEIGRDALLRRLTELGYEHAPEVECVGEFSVRGGIVDVFPVNATLPVRVEFFGDEVDSLRDFEPETKRSVRNLTQVSVLPLANADAAESSSAFFSYMADGGTVLFDEPTRFRETLLRVAKEDPEAKKSVFSWEELLEEAASCNVMYAALMLQKIHGAEPSEIVGATAKAVSPYRRQMDLFASDVRDWMHDGQRILILMGDAAKSSSMRELLAKYRVPAVVLPNPDVLSDGSATVAEGTLTEGFEFPEAKVVVISERDVFGRQKKKLRAPKAPDGTRISHFREIRAGDYVVHVVHGIGKYLGVETIESGGVKRDYLHIKYGGDDKLFVPTDQVQLLQKYIGAEGEAPRLSRMGGAEWNRAKARAKAAVEDIAEELIKLYAKRRSTPGVAFAEDTPWQREFEDAFPFEETPDQLAALREIKADMEKPAPMDRLLCGDVGFGKTEVAVRAAFKAVMGGKQVAVLVPTTVLAQQHYQTFTERFLNFGPTVDVVCRFRTQKEQKAALERVRDGRTDILIGTHAILNQKRVVFKDLGLLIVDEEQRFGVKQKERIKEISAGIDVLTLSATPIPRTLHMSLVGARDMSVIETPPAERYPIQTYVIESNDAILAGAIRRELKRGGQIYFIYNRIETIERMRLRLEALVPEARIRTAHGQMTEAVLERVMMEFYEGEYDILLSTSIVENGLDVANANTIIVYNADRFGLSQLYQMRGRVGRSHRMAYAYFVYQADKVLTEAAEKRLHAMKEFAELGAGFKIAMRDLEIRGAGDLLGAQQHGHIASVGFEMYCRLLDEAVRSLETGKPVEEQPEPVIEIEVEAYLDGAFIDDAMHKIEIYQRIAAVRTEQHIASLLDELIDRFGEPTESVLRLLKVAQIKNYLRNLGVKSVVEKENFVEFTLAENHKVEPERVVALRKKLGKALMLLPSQQIFRVRFGKKPDQDKLLDMLLKVCKVLAGEPAEEKAEKKGDKS